MLREKFKWRTHKNESTDAQHGGGSIRSSVEAAVMAVERRDWIIPVSTSINFALLGKGGMDEEDKTV